MAEALWMVNRAKRMGRQDRDEIHNVLINSDDGGSAAVVIAAAVAMVNAQMPETAGSGEKLPDGYFDTAVIVSDLAAGPLATDGDGYVLGEIKASLET